MDAIVLAGGPVPTALQGEVRVSERALIPVQGVPMVHRVISELLNVTPVTRIVCVAPPAVKSALPPEVEWLESGELLSQNLLAGIRAAQSDRVLVATGDVPLATARTWMQFLDGAFVNSLDFAYAVVTREAMEEQFPGGTRTYAPLKDGHFTGGNGFLLPRHRLDEFEALVERAFVARKNPLALARLLGAGFVARAVTRRLSIQDIEEKVGTLLRARVGAVVVPDASIAFDVDKPQDLHQAERLLEKRLANGAANSSQHESHESHESHVSA